MLRRERLEPHLAASQHDGLELHLPSPRLSSARRMDARLSAPATQRNREPILAVLRRVLPPSGALLEIASGTGEHAVYFAAQLPERIYQPSDPDPAHRASIAAWSARRVRPGLAAGSDRARHGTPRLGDERGRFPPISRRSCASTWCTSLPGARARSPARRRRRARLRAACWYLYGPYRRGGRHTAASNETFDRSLRAQNPDGACAISRRSSRAADAEALRSRRSSRCRRTTCRDLRRRRDA